MYWNPPRPDSNNASRRFARVGAAAHLAFGLAVVGLTLSGVGGPDPAAGQTDPAVAERRATRQERMNEPLTSADLRADVAALREALAAAWAHAGHTDAAAVARALAEIETAADRSLTTNEFGRALQRVLARSADSHAEVRGVSWPEGALPFLLEPAGAGLVAIRSDRTDFVAAGRPYLVALDGIALGRWLDTARALVPQGPPAGVRRRAARRLRRVAMLRTEMGLPASDQIAVTVRGDGDGGDSTFTMTLEPDPPPTLPWPNRLSGKVENRFGYLRLKTLSGQAAGQIESWMKRLRHLKGLVIDLRGITGSDLAAMQELVAFLTWRTDPPRVTAIARCRDGDLRNPVACPRPPLWHTAEAADLAPMARDTLASFAATAPEICTGLTGGNLLLAAGAAIATDFTEPFYLVASKDPGDERFVYEWPVVVLVDGTSAGAVNLLIASLRPIPRLTVLGTETAGGHGFVASVRLPRSDLLVFFAASCVELTDGTSLDEAGIVPDLPVRLKPGDLLQDGTDAQLAAAIQNLRMRER